MSDLISVRVTLGSYDAVHPSEQQTQVYVQIPEVARASWFLDADLYHALKDSPWSNVVDVAHSEYERRRVVSDSTSAAARKAIVEWLFFGGDANRDEVQAAFEEDHARRDPVRRKLLARIAELEAQRDALVERLRAGQQWRRGRDPELVSENLVSQSELREIFGIPLVAPWVDVTETEAGTTLTFTPRGDAS